MKTLPAPYAAHVAGSYLSLAGGLFLVRRDGQAFGLTSCGTTSVLDVRPWWNGTGADAFALDHAQGLLVSDLVTTAGLEVGNAEITTLDDGTFFDRADIYKGLWDGAKFWVFRYDYTAAATVADVEVLMGGEVGEVGINLNTIVLELRDIAKRLQEERGIIISRTCRQRLGGPICRVNLASYTVPLTITGVGSDSRRVFTCSAATQPADWFGEGKVLIKTGANAGMWAKVVAFSGGEFTLVLRAYAPFQVGDTLDAVAGCRGRHERSLDNPAGVSDCIDKFNNILNFDGEPWVPPTDYLTASPNPDA
jgi:uncharacterized phage protein (TIGR02218 family)